MLCLYRLYLIDFPLTRLLMLLHVTRNLGPLATDWFDILPSFIPVDFSHVSLLFNVSLNMFDWLFIYYLCLTVFFTSFVCRRMLLIFFILMKCIILKILGSAIECLKPFEYSLSNHNTSCWVSKFDGYVACVQGGKLVAGKMIVVSHIASSVVFHPAMVVCSLVMSLHKLSSHRQLWGCARLWGLVLVWVKFSLL